MNKNDIQNLNEAYDQIQETWDSSGRSATLARRKAREAQLKKKAAEAVSNPGISIPSPEPQSEEYPPYTRQTSRGYEVSLPFPDGEIEIEHEGVSGAERLYVTKEDILMILKRFDEKRR